MIQRYKKSMIPHKLGDYYPGEDGLWCTHEDVTELESELAAVQAENEKLREIFKIYWINQEKVHTERSAESFLKLGEHFDFWLKQELEGIC